MERGLSLGGTKLEAYSSPNSTFADGVVPRVSSKLRRRRPCFFAFAFLLLSVAEVLDAIFFLLQIRPMANPPFVDKNERTGSAEFLPLE